MRSSSRNDRGLAARALTLAPREWCDLVIAAVELGRARLKLRRTSAERLLDKTAETSRRAEDASPAQRVERVRTAIARVSHRVPWRADCLVQAIAAQHWLGRHGLPSRVRVGVRDRGADPFEAHAWLVCGNTIVTGGSVSDYSPLRPPAR